jgi:hypothetical protein
MCVQNKSGEMREYFVFIIAFTVKSSFSIQIKVFTTATSKKGQNTTMKDLVEQLTLIKIINTETN